MQYVLTKGFYGMISEEAIHTEQHDQSPVVHMLSFSTSSTPKVNQVCVCIDLQQNVFVTF